MTLHTQVALSAGDVDAAEVFAFCRTLIGAGDGHSAYENNPLHMKLGQGLPALMWVTPGDGEAERCDDLCEYPCSGQYHDPPHAVMVHFDTAYSYQGVYRWGRQAGCGDLHAHLVREVGRWADERGLTWRWYDESGDGWAVTHADLGNLGSPRLGGLGLRAEVAS